MAKLAAKAAISIGKFCAMFRFPRLGFGKVGENGVFGLPPPRLPKFLFAAADDWFSAAPQGDYSNVCSKIVISSQLTVISQRQKAQSAEQAAKV